jgi:lipoprotein-anchoring transpeptidase ErfK/SrfK
MNPKTDLNQTASRVPPDRNRKTAMKTLAILAAAATIGFATPSHAEFSLLAMFAPQPHVVAKVSIAQQTMDLTIVDGRGQPTSYIWKVSTGRTGFDTPTGAFHPTWLDANHVSKTYDDAKMPYAVFFTGGFAIHATDAVGRLGHVASHGCVRLAPQNAALFFDLVKTYGRSNTEIVITD